MRVLFVVLLFVTARVSGDEPSRFIRAEMQQHGVPGISVAVIRGHEIASTGAFGVANTITREPVTTDTVFAVASNGKPVAAYIAVRLARLGVLNLHEPVKRITPIHLMSHTSGLGNFLRDRRRALRFTPGERFEYSGVGFVVLQELLEQRTNRTLDQLAREHVFTPLKIGNAWYGERPAIPMSIAAPHIALIDALAPFVLVATPLTVIFSFIAAVAMRIRHRRWSFGWSAASIAFALAAAITFAFLLQRSGSWTLTVWFSLIPIVVIVGLALLLRVLASRVARFAIIVIVAAVVLALRNVPLPLPTSEIGPPNAASSLRATAPALARFIIELSRPHALDRAAVAEMTKPVVRIDETASWALGIGVERHAAGHDLWHWGSNPGAKSIMIVCPETGDGVVVLTNGSEGSDAMRNIAAKVLGRRGCWRAGCA